MHIPILSDIHSNLPALHAIVEDIARRGVDAIVNPGDSLSGPSLPLETAQFLVAQVRAQLANPRGQRDRESALPTGYIDAARD